MQAAWETKPKSWITFSLITAKKKFLLASHPKFELHNHNVQLMCFSVSVQHTVLYVLWEALCIESETKTMQQTKNENRISNPNQVFIIFKKTKESSRTFSPSAVWIDNIDNAGLCFFTSLILDVGITTYNVMRTKIYMYIYILVKHSQCGLKHTRPRQSLWSYPVSRLLK